MRGDQQKEKFTWRYYYHNLLIIVVLRAREAPLWGRVQGRETLQGREKFCLHKM